MPEKLFRMEKFAPLPEESLEELYRNKRFDLPFDPKMLGAFLDRQGGALELRTLPYHHRSADLGVSTIIRERDKRDRPGNVYCQFDLKGVGFLFPESYESRKDQMYAGALSGYPEAFLSPHSVEDMWGYRSLGLLDERVAMGVVRRVEELTQEGLRSEAILGVYRLSELRVGGQAVSVKDWKERVAAKWRLEMAQTQDPAERKHLADIVADLLPNYDPVMVARAMRSVFRLRDLRDAENPAQARAMLSEACANLNFESEALGRKQKFFLERREDREAWLRFVAFWMGKNIGILHARNLSHAYANMGNFTLAGELVDLDSVGEVLEKKIFRGKPENKQRWLEKGDGARSYRERPFFRETADGCVMSSEGYYEKPDERFGLPKLLIKDLRDGCFSLREMTRAVRKLFDDRYDTSRLAEEIRAGYVEGLSSAKAVEELGIDPARLQAAMQEMAGEIVGRGQAHPPIPPDREWK